MHEREAPWLLLAMEGQSGQPVQVAALLETVQQTVLVDSHEGAIDILVAVQQVDDIA